MSGRVDIRAVAVVGAGTMGAGLAQLFAQSGFEVRLFDLSEEILGKAQDRVLRGLERAERPAAFSLIRTTTSLKSLASCDMAIEAAAEDLRAKRDIFRQLDNLLEPPRLLATNTSSLLVGDVAAATENPDRVAGMHFFNPPTIMRLVEVVRAPHASDAAIETALAVAGQLGKTPVRCKDTPGFIANRVARPFYLAGMRLLEERRGSPAAIDRALREAGGFRMGPFELMDLIGLDVNLAITKTIYAALGCPERLKPRRVQEALVALGNHGRKNSRGFYVYGDNGPYTVNPALEDILPGTQAEPARPPEVLRAVLEPVIDEARAAFADGVASREDIDTAMRLGLNWPKGPFEWDRELAR